MDNFVNKNQLPVYKEYQFGIGESLMYRGILFILGGLVGFVFYGNLFMKEGELTIYSHISNIIVFVLAGILINCIFIKEIKKNLIEKRKIALRKQFREMMAALSTAYAAGDNSTRAFAHAYEDMKAQFGVSADISRELFEIVYGQKSGLDPKVLLWNFGERSGIEDIIDFANIYMICEEMGGDTKSVVRHSYEVIGQKMEINDEIQTRITSNQTQQRIMAVVPIFMIAFLKFSSSSFAASFASLKGVISLTVAAGIFIFSYLYGKKIVDIKG